MEYDCSRYTVRGKQLQLSSSHGPESEGSVAQSPGVLDIPDTQGLKGSGIPRAQRMTAAKKER